MGEDWRGLERVRDTMLTHPSSSVSSHSSPPSTPHPSTPPPFHLSTPLHLFIPPPLHSSPLHLSILHPSTLPPLHSSTPPLLPVICVDPEWSLQDGDVFQSQQGGRMSQGRQVHLCTLRGGERKVCGMRARVCVWRMWCGMCVRVCVVCETCVSQLTLL